MFPNNTFYRRNEINDVTRLSGVHMDSTYGAFAARVQNDVSSNDMRAAVCDYNRVFGKPSCFRFIQSVCKSGLADVGSVGLSDCYSKCAQSR